MPRGPHKSQIKKHVCQTHRPCTWSLICLWPYRSSCRRCSAGSSCPNVFRWTEPLEFPFPDSLSRTWGACDSPPRHHTAASSWSLTRETKFTLDEKKNVWSECFTQRRKTSAKSNASCEVTVKNWSHIRDRQGCQQQTKAAPQCPPREPACCPTVGHFLCRGQREFWVAIFKHALNQLHSF